ncbi:MAG: hypothetical protein IT377_24655 [Polyangiaceae bacterium]|nr:hypothetical protein [Polyangiaceae bacterium]
MRRSNMVRCNKKLPLLALALWALGCEASSPADECHTGSDCPSGACNDGRCVSASGGAAGAAGRGGAAAGGGGTAGAGGGAAGSGGAGGAASGGSGGGFCSPNHDGVLDKSETPLAAGLAAKFLVSGPAAVPSAGVAQGDGSRLWDFSAGLSGDHLVLVETQKLDGKWFAAKYPGATYAARLSESSDLLGVFEVGATALVLRGVVSPADGVTKTELTYTPPVVVLDFPVKEGKTWSTSSTVTGFAQGVLANYTEGYESAVDAHGTLKAPFGEFPVLRTRVVLTRKIGFVTTVVRSYLYGAECFGTVASFVAKDNATTAEVSEAAELRRLAP